MMRVGIGYDSHRLASGRRLVLGGVDIPHEKGLLGHSDADALLHALGDALLGAIGAGDIGTHFPDSDPAFKDISSMILLDRIVRLVEDAGYAVHHVDAAILLEEPKLKDYIPLMIARIASVLNTDAGNVSIKAKTNEGMGFIGRGEGVAVLAAATILPQENP